MGIEPDAVMHSCAVKFAVKAGRRDLSEDLFNSAPEVDVHNYMCLMRAAGRDGQVRSGPGGARRAGGASA